MKTHRIDVKLCARFRAPLEHFLPTLHTWVAEGALGEIWVDVAPYLHVPNGPGLVAVAHHGLFALDQRDGIDGIRYQTRRPRDPDGPALDVEAQVAYGVERVLAATVRLRARHGPEALDVDPHQWFVGVPDRLLAPPDEVAWAEARAAVERAMARATGATAVRCDPDRDARRGLRFAVGLEGRLRPDLLPPGDPPRAAAPV